MSSNITIRTTPKSRVSLNTGSRNKLTVKTGSAVPGGGAPTSEIDTIRELRDVDASDLDTNETLVYDGSSGKFVVKELPLIDGGTF